MRPNPAQEDALVSLPRTCESCGAKLYHYAACSCAPKAIAPTPEREALIAYLLSDEYRWLLRRAVEARYGTSTNYKVEHEKALRLFAAAYSDRE